MGNARFWTGLAVFAALPLGVAMSTVGGASVRSSTLEGKIRLGGQAVAEGILVFESLDRKQSADIMLSVGPDGRFGRRVEWLREMTGRVPFRVHLLVGTKFNRQSPEISLGVEPTRLEIELKD